MNIGVCGWAMIITHIVVKGTKGEMRMSKIEDGGCAFPFEGGQNNGVSPEGGMTLRDYFAGQALVGIGTWMPVPEVGYPHLMSQETLKQRSEWAYAQADAMIAARKVGEA